MASEKQSKGPDASTPVGETEPRNAPAAPASASKGAKSAVWNPGDVILDLYEVKEVFEGGGMGLVYRVHHRNWNVDLAVKSPRPEYFRTEQHKQNFEREAETWINLGLHPHTVSCYYVRRIESVPLVFAEYVEGGSLADWIRDGRLYEGGPAKALERILDIAIQFAWGLHYAHEEGLIHQDVKPANVLLTSDGTAKVTDFGLARARIVTGEPTVGGGQRSILVSSGGMTPAYCSPEQAQGETLTRKTDIWSWAVSVLEMFTGEVTWASGTVAGEALKGYLETESGDRLPRMPSGLAELLRRCFQQEPESRPEEMQGIAKRLQEMYQQSIGSAYSRTVPRPIELRATSLNNRALSLLDLGKRQAAEKQLQEALAQDPQHPEATYNLGLLHWRSGQITDEQLVHQLDTVCQAHSGTWLPLYLLAQVHLERGDCQGALRVLGEVPAADAGRAEVQASRRTAEVLGPQSRRLLNTFEGHTDQVYAVAFSVDGRWIVSGSKDKTVRLWEAATGRSGLLRGHTDWVLAVAFSADGRWVVSGSRDRKIKLWETATGQCRRTEWNFTRALAVSADGRWLVLGGRRGSENDVEVWDGAMVHYQGALQGHTDTVQAMAVSADGRLIVSGSCDTTIRYWDTDTSRSGILHGHTAEVGAVAISADGRWIVSGSRDKTVKLWEAATDQCQHTLQGHTESVTAVALSADGRWIVSGSHDKTIKLWEAGTGQCRRTFQGHASVFAVALSADGRRIVSGSEDQTLKLWETAPQWYYRAPDALGQLVAVQAAMASVSAFEEAMAKAQAAFADADHLAAMRWLRQARAQAGYERHSQSIAFWAQLYPHLPRGGFKDIWQIRTLQGHTDNVYAVAFSADGRWIVSGSDDGTVKLWEAATGQCRRTLQGHTTFVRTVALSADGRWIVSGSEDNSIKLWEAATGQCQRTFKGHTNPVSVVAISADGRWIVSGSAITADEIRREFREEKGVKLWEAATGKCRRTLQAATSIVAISADGRWIVSGNTLWEIATDKCRRTFGADVFVRAMARALSTDGRWIVSGNAEGTASGNIVHTVRLWEVATGECRHILRGHTDLISDVAISADGHWIVSVSRDKTIKLWEAASGECQRTLSGHADIVRVVLSADGGWIASCRDKTVELWFLDWELEDKSPADWDEGARPHLATFLSTHTPYAGVLSEDRDPTEEELTLALTRRGKPTWTEADFQHLLYSLGCAGYGWLRPDGVRSELEKMAADWQGPPPLA